MDPQLDYWELVAAEIGLEDDTRLAQAIHSLWLEDKQPLGLWSMSRASKLKWRQMNKQLEKEWAEYQNSLILPDAPYLQVRESRRAFYAGAMCLLKILSNIVSMGEEIQAEDMLQIAAINQELKDFVKNVESGLA
jgi:hypothetical protein